MRLTLLTSTILLSLTPTAAPAQAISDASLGAKPPEGAVVLFGGKDLDSWTKAGSDAAAAWPVTDGIFTVAPKTGSIQTRDKFGDIQLHVEFNVPLMPDAKGQARGNSGVYVDGIYEVQILDSFGLVSKNNDCAGVYTQAAPRVNACKPPLQWQSYDITFKKATRDGDKVTKKAFIKIVHNGVTVIDQEVGTTPGGVSGVKEGEDGPLMLQDHGNLVQFRNIWVKPL
jgi:hypothetical protein